MLRPDGTIAARYDKLHLFDIDLDKDHVYRESATIAPGEVAIVSPCTEGLIGLSICYDLRFPHLYRAQAKAGAEILAVPAAFTRKTGEAHWHILNRARAIENGAYVIAPCQYGTLAGGSACFGHSLIVDPWGRVLADGGEAEGVIVAEIDLDLVRQTRSRIPSLRHDRAFA
jgi:predicted amidohydrolase